jgi:hypothetical protein
MRLPLFCTRALGSSEFFLRKNAPTILTGAGVIGFVATVAVTIHVGPKAMDRLQTISIDVADLKSRPLEEDKTEEDRAKELVELYVRSSIDLARIYAPTILLGSASIICVLSAHNMMLKRQASLAAAYTALSVGYEAYRKRVAEKIGVEEELQLYRGVSLVQGCNDQGEPCEIIDMSDSDPSPYSMFFDEQSPSWNKNAEYNKFFLRSQQTYLNNRLHARGYLFLNEVHDALGLPWTQAGQVVGWRVADPKCRKCHIDQKCDACKGDGYVDFGIYDIYDSMKRAFVNGFENVILLDFNVDGEIIGPRGNSKTRI